MMGNRYNPPAPSRFSVGDVVVLSPEFFYQSRKLPMNSNKETRWIVTDPNPPGLGGQVKVSRENEAIEYIFAESHLQFFDEAERARQKEEKARQLRLLKEEQAKLAREAEILKIREEENRQQRFEDTLAWMKTQI